MNFDVTSQFIELTLVNSAIGSMLTELRQLMASIERLHETGKVRLGDGFKAEPGSDLYAAMERLARRQQSLQLRTKEMLAGVTLDPQHQAKGPLAAGRGSRREVCRPLAEIPLSKLGLAAFQGHQHFPRSVLVERSPLIELLELVLRHFSEHVEVLQGQLAVLQACQLGEP